MASCPKPTDSPNPETRLENPSISSHLADTDAKTISNNQAPTMSDAPQPRIIPQASSASPLRLKLNKTKRKGASDQTELEPAKKKSRVFTQSEHDPGPSSLAASNDHEAPWQTRDCKAMYQELKKKMDSLVPELESFKRHVDVCEKSRIADASQAHQLENEDKAPEAQAASTMSDAAETDQADEPNTVSKLKSKLKKRNEQLSDAISRAEKAKDQAKDLRAENDRLRRSVKEMDTENDGLVKDNADLEQKIDDMGNSYADRDLYYTKVTDEEITGPWNNMIFLIGQVVSNYLQNPPLVGEGTIAEMNEYTPGILRLSHETKNASASFKECRFQGYIWRRIEKDIFRGLKVDWVEPVTKAFLALNGELTNVGWKNTSVAKIMSTIKAETAYRVDSHFATDETALGRYTDDVVRDLSVFITHDDPEQPFRAKMSQIIRAAEKLRKIMMMSKAFFRVNIPNYKGQTRASIKVVGGVNVQFSEHTDEYDEETVLHVITPELWKCGVADGWDFEHKTLLCNAVVVVSRSKKEEEAHLATPERSVADNQHQGLDLPSEQAKELDFQNWLHKVEDKVEDEAEEEPSDDSGDDDGSNYSDN